MSGIIEIRWHGIGGMGVVTASDLVASAAVSEGKYAQSFPSYGIERRGAPVVAFLRISDEFIGMRTNIYHPDIVVIAAPKLLQQGMDVTAGLKEGGKVLINSNKSPGELKSEYGFKWPVASVNASKIATETIKLPICNTSLMGALERISNVVKMDSLIEQLRERFGKRADANIEAMKRAYDETIMEG